MTPYPTCRWRWNVPGKTVDKKSDSCYDFIYTSVSERSEDGMTQQQQTNLGKLLALGGKWKDFAKLFGFKDHPDYFLVNNGGNEYYGNLFGLAALVGLFNGEGLWAVTKNGRTYISRTPKGKALDDSEIEFLLHEIFGDVDPDYDDALFGLGEHGDIDEQVKALHAFLAYGGSIRHVVHWKMSGTMILKGYASEDEARSYAESLGYRDIIAHARTSGTLDEKQLIVETVKPKKRDLSEEVVLFGLSCKEYYRGDGTSPASSSQWGPIAFATRYPLGTPLPKNLGPVEFRSLDGTPIPIHPASLLTETADGEDVGYDHEDGSDDGEEVPF